MFANQIRLRRIIQIDNCMQIKSDFCESCEYVINQIRLRRIIQIQYENQIFLIFAWFAWFAWLCDFMQIYANLCKPCTPCKYTI